MKKLSVIYPDLQSAINQAGEKFTRIVLVSFFKDILQQNCIEEDIVRHGLNDFIHSISSNELFRSKLSRLHEIYCESYFGRERGNPDHDTATLCKATLQQVSIIEALLCAIEENSEGYGDAFYALLSANIGMNNGGRYLESLQRMFGVRVEHEMCGEVVSAQEELR